MTLGFLFIAVVGSALLITESRIRREYAIYTAVSMAVIVSRTYMQGSMRYMLPVFPLFLLLALRLEKRPIVAALIAFVFGALQAFYFAAFVLHAHWAST